GLGGIDEHRDVALGRLPSGRERRARRRESLAVGDRRGVDLQRRAGGRRMGEDYRGGDGGGKDGVHGFSWRCHVSAVLKAVSTSSEGNSTEATSGAGRDLPSCQIRYILKKIYLKRVFDVSPPPPLPSRSPRSPRPLRPSPRRRPAPRS